MAGLTDPNLLYGNIGSLNPMMLPGNGALISHLLAQKSPFHANQTNWMSAMMNNKALSNFWMNSDMKVIYSYLLKCLLHFMKFY